MPENNGPAEMEHPHSLRGCGVPLESGCGHSPFPLTVTMHPRATPRLPGGEGEAGGPMAGDGRGLTFPEGLLCAAVEQSSL